MWLRSREIHERVSHRWVRALAGDFWFHPRSDVLIDDAAMPWELKPEGRDG